MRETACEKTRRELALGEPPTSGEVAAHLRSCEACQKEAARLGGLIALLTEEAEVSPDRELDRQIRSMIREIPEATRTILRPRLAIVMAAIALLAGIIAVVGLVARGESARDDLFLAFGIIWTYLAVSSAATLPILIHRKRPIRHPIHEVVQ